MAGPTGPERVSAPNPFRLTVEAGHISGIPHHGEIDRFIGRSGIPVVAPDGHALKRRLAHLRPDIRARATATHGQKTG